jgi:hypothetical protein
VTPALEVAHIGLVAVVVVERLLAVVEHVGDDGTDGILGHTSSDVLAVTTTLSITEILLVGWRIERDIISTYTLWA